MKDVSGSTVLRMEAARTASRWQRERVTALITTKAPFLGLTARVIAHELVWPLDCAEAWIRVLLDAGELRVFDGDEGLKEPRYVTVDVAIAAMAQADGGA